MKITEHFDSHEFRSQWDNIEYPEKWLEERLRPLCERLEIVREAIGKPLKITSGYRTPENNKRIGGATNSYHLQGKAADVHVDGMTGHQISDLVQQLIKDGKISEGGVGTYDNFCHIDIRDHRARWTG